MRFTQFGALHQISKMPYLRSKSKMRALSFTFGVLNALIAVLHVFGTANFPLLILFIGHMSKSSLWAILANDLCIAVQVHNYTKVKPKFELLGNEQPFTV